MLVLKRRQGGTDKIKNGCHPLGQTKGLGGAQKGSQPNPVLSKNSSSQDHVLAEWSARVVKNSNDLKTPASGV